MKRKTILTLSIMGIGLIAFSATTSLAWFTRLDRIYTDDENDGIKGEMFKGYFHGGTGTVTDPYTITRPKHWENLVWLHNNVDGFYNAKQTETSETSGHGYYFQIGVPNLDGSGTTTPQVYQYNDDGTPVMVGNKNAVSTSTLNLTCYSEEGKELIPIGSPQYPFIGALEGNGFTLKGFKIISYDKYHDNIDLEDIGIFGYVGPAYGATEDDPAITNIYFSDYTIDTSSASLDEDKTYIHHPSHLDPYETEEDWYGKAYIGSIAGHINSSGSFDDVYVNRCTIEGESDDDCGQLSNYGYFGKVEEGKSGSTHGSGYNYNFKLSSSAVYNYMRDNYNTYSNNPIAIRNAEYEINKDPKGTIFDDRTTIHPFNEGIKYVTSGFNTYNMVGDDPDDYSAGQYKGYNYSLSTMGYWPMTEDGETKEYALKAKGTSSGSYYDIPEDTVIQSSLNSGEAGYVQPLSEKLTQFGQNGKYMHYDSSAKQWDYYYVHTHQANDMRTVNLTFRANNVTIKSSDRELIRDPSIQEAVFQAFVDYNPCFNGYQDISGKVSASRVDRSGLSYRIQTTWNFSFTVQLQLAVGVHHIGAMGAMRVNLNYFRHNGIYYGSNCVNDGNDFDLTGNEFVIKDTDPSVINKTIDLTERIFPNAYSTNTDSPEIHSKDSSSYTPYIYPDSYGTADYVYASRTPIGGDFDVNNNAIFAAYNYVTFIPNKGKDSEGNPYYHLYAREDAVKSIPDGAKEVWLADEINKYYDVTETSYYDAENIDVVGGGIRFGTNYVTFDGENSTRTLVKTIQAGDIGQKFYATKYCANSVVLMLKNVGGTNADDAMGAIQIKYQWLNFFCDLLFKKGQGNGTDDTGRYVELSSVADEGDITDNRSGTTRTVTILLRRKYLKNASFCAVNRDGIIIANYDGNGNQVFPASPVKDTDVYKYVLCLGIESLTILGIDVNARINEISFAYTASKGFGGTFGSVEYRSSGDTVEDTILNFYFMIPENDKFKVYVTYNSSRYDVTFNYFTTRAGGSLQVFVYCYDLAFSVYVNNTQVAANGSEEITIPSASF